MSLLAYETYLSTISTPQWLFECLAQWLLSTVLFSLQLSSIFKERLESAKKNFRSTIKFSANFTVASLIKYSVS